MCGIVGLFAKSPEIEARLGEHLAAMLVQMSDRGPDSAGVAVYRDPAPAGWSKLTLYAADPGHGLGAVGGELAERVRRRRGGVGAREARGARRRGRRRRGRGLGARAAPRAARDERRPRDRDLQGGRPARGVRRAFALADFQGTHGLGHTRMATESRVTTEGSHPFSTGHDLCLVHNGSLSNHNRLRESLRREGIEFQTENDTEVAAGYLTWRLREGASLEQALEGCLDDLDGFYTFARRHGGRLRGAARPDRVQAGRARRDRRLGGDGVRVPRDRGAARAPPTRAMWEPEPRVVYAWEKAAVADGGRRRPTTVEVVDLGDDVAPRAEPAAARRRRRRRRPAPLARRSTRTARTRSPAASTRDARGRDRRPRRATTAPG